MGAEELFLCQYCSRIFHNRKTYNRHINTHTKPSKCEYCGRGFALVADLIRHKSTRHRVDETKHHCTIFQCPFQSTRKDNLQQHLRQIHGLREELAADGMRLVKYSRNQSQPDLVANVKGGTALTPLQYAVKHNSLNDVETQLQAKIIDVNAQSQESSALDLAVRYGRIEALELRLQHQGIGPNCSQTNARKCYLEDNPKGGESDRTGCLDTLLGGGAAGDPDHVSSDPSDNDDFSPEPASPMLGGAPKRQKASASSQVDVYGSSNISANPTRQTYQQKSTLSEASTASQLKTLNDKLSQGENSSRDKEEVAAFSNLPAGDYSQHPFTRSTPITNNGTVRIPPNVQRNFKPRKSAAEFQRELQGRVKEKLREEFGWGP